MSKSKYGRDWKRIRDQYIKFQPLCELCLKAGRYRKADEVHHIIPMSFGGKHTKDNLMSLCSYHHKRLHAALDRKVIEESKRKKVDE